MRLRCYKDLVKYGADKLLQAQFGSRFQSSPESGWDVTLLLDLAHAPDNKDEFAQNVGNMKRTCISAPFEIAFAELDKVHFDKEYKVEQELMSVHYREQETMWIRAQQDRVTVIFSTVFNEETDRVFGKVFLQEFVDARKQLTLQNAPQVISSKEAPLELRHLPNLSNGDDKQEVNYITFGTTDAHD
jgi:actin related protein 2/3 complex subunit 2